MKYSYTVVEPIIKIKRLPFESGLMFDISRIKMYSRKCIPQQHASKKKPFIITRISGFILIDRYI